MTASSVSAARTTPRPRSLVRSVAVPSEHGGWGLTLEPGLLGLLVAPSAAGALLAIAALIAFVSRTPLKVVLVDRWRGRRLERTVIAARVVLITGHRLDLQQLIERTLEKGADAVCYKPFEMPDLISLIGRLAQAIERPQ